MTIPAVRAPSDPPKPRPALRLRRHPALSNGLD